MATVKNLLSSKGGEVWSVSPNAKLIEALQLMKKKKIGAIIVVEDKRIEGIFSERDLVGVIVDGDDVKTEPISKYMTRSVFYIRPDISLDECMALMIDKRIRHLPVLDGDDLVGVISIRDLVKEVISQKDITIKGLENFLESSVNPL